MKKILATILLLATFIGAFSQPPIHVRTNKLIIKSGDGTADLKLKGGDLELTKFDTDLVGVKMLIIRTETGKIDTLEVPSGGSGGSGSVDSFYNATTSEWLSGNDTIYMNGDSIRFLSLVQSCPSTPLLLTPIYNATKAAAVAAAFQLPFAPCDLTTQITGATNVNQLDGQLLSRMPIDCNGNTSGFDLSVMEFNIPLVDLEGVESIVFHFENVTSAPILGQEYVTAIIPMTDSTRLNDEYSNANDGNSYLLQSGNSSFELKMVTDSVFNIYTQTASPFNYKEMTELNLLFVSFDQASYSIDQIRVEYKCVSGTNVVTVDGQGNLIMTTIEIPDEGTNIFKSNGLVTDPERILEGIGANKMIIEKFRNIELIPDELFLAGFENTAIELNEKDSLLSLFARKTLTISGAKTRIQGGYLEGNYDSTYFDFGAMSIQSNPTYGHSISAAYDMDFYIPNLTIHGQTGGDTLLFDYSTGGDVIFRYGGNSNQGIKFQRIGSGEINFNSINQDNSLNSLLAIDASGNLRFRDISSLGSNDNFANNSLLFTTSPVHQIGDNTLTINGNVTGTSGINFIVNSFGVQGHANETSSFHVGQNGMMFPTYTMTNRPASPQAGTTIYCTDCNADDAVNGVLQTYRNGSWKNHW